MKIRPETPQDISAIEQVTRSAFDGKPYSNQTEHLVVNGLREAGATSISLVAEIEKSHRSHRFFGCDN